MVTCKHAANGCGYPQGECSGACMTEQVRESQRLIRATVAKAPRYLTVVYKITEPGQPREILERNDWTASSHTHVIRERDRAEAELGKLTEQRDELLKVLRMARANIAANLQVMTMCHTGPDGMIDDAEVVLLIEAEQDLVNQIDAVIAKATGEQT